MRRGCDTIGSMQTIATTTAGQLQGREKRGVLRFAGIPFAAPPVGAGRFRPPTPSEGWSGVRDATSFGPVSWQQPGLLGGFLAGPPPTCAEDCLTLNVFTPALDDGRRPVLVWIHGGGFTGGSGSTPWYDGTSFCQRGDVVVVTINYRLGALGFLHLAELGADYASSGLNGILDQVAALEWVRDNIAAFGGDPGDVTIFGESAGAMSVGTLLGLPRAHGLFHKAVAFSGAASNLVPPDRAADITALVGELAGVTEVGDLLELAPEALLEAQNQVSQRLIAEGMRAADASAPRADGLALTLGMPFQPVLDGVELPRPPLDAIRDGHAADVTLVTGTTTEEWNLFHLMSPGALDDARLLRRLGRFVGDDAATIVDAYREEHPGATADELWCSVLTDVIFRIPAVRMAEAQAAHRPDDTRMYEFAWRTPVFDGKLGACHALDVPFTFNVMDRGGVNFFVGDEPPLGLSEVFHDAWWHLARTGHPNHAGLPAWPAYSAADRQVLTFDDPACSVVADPRPHTRAVWDTVAALHG